MKRYTTTVLLLIASIFMLWSCNNKATEETGDTEGRLYDSSKPYTRWWWFSAEIDTNDVREQLMWLKDHEFGGVEIAWIYPMFCDSTTKHPDFLSEEWAKPVEYAKRCADELGLGCDFTYGTMWPFADVDLPAGDETRNYFDSIEIAQRPLVWDHPKVARILNHLDKNAFERYAAHVNSGLKGAYKGKKSGLFVDSWEVETEYLWTRGFEKTFMEEHGYDIEPYMKEKKLMDAKTHEIYDRDVFYDYMHTLSGYVMREFYGPYAENAREQGCFSRAQCGGAPTDLLTAFTMVDIPETEAILYEPCFSKITASAATLGDKQAVTAETFTCAYGWTSLRSNNFRGHSPHQGKEQIGDLKLICDALFSNGTNQIIWHGFPYNKVGDTSNFFYTTCQVSTSELCNLSGDALTEFNRYMTTVSKYMRKGRNYSDLAVYMPLEDSWMNGAYPDSLQLPWMWGQYEMRYINTPTEYKGMQPLWVNEKYLSEATYKDGVLKCGAATFKGLYIDVEYMELSALKTIIRLAEEGLPICMVREPQEPGKNKHAEYAENVAKLISIANVKRDGSAFAHKGLIEGEGLPDFWIREDSETYYVFVANPMTQTIKYPLEYCYAFKDKGCTKEVTINHHGRSDKTTLKFKPTESLMLKVDKSGVTQINLGYIARKMRTN